MKQPEPSLTLPTFSPLQRDQLDHFQELALSFNARVNLYSEASTEHFWKRHVMHSLAIATRSFPTQSRVVDWGTGGGLPGLPLAIVFPNIEFVLIDSVGKKIQAVQTMARRLGLQNVTAWHGRAEEWQGEITHSVSRATSALRTLWMWHDRVARSETSASTNEWPAGLLCLKGGELESEIGELLALKPTLIVRRFPLGTVLGKADFQTKELIQVSRES